MVVVRYPGLGQCRGMPVRYLQVMGMTADTDELMQALAARLADHGWGSVKGLLSETLITSLADHARRLWEEGEFRPAGIGRGPTFQVRGDIRNDFVRWMDAEVGKPFDELQQQVLEPLRQCLNRELQLGLFNFEGHLAVYPPGSFYRRHVDQFQNTGYRRISLAIYLNAEWMASDGGELVLYPSTDGGQPEIILPEAGTVVCFLSEMHHEVRLTRRERYSLTGWFRTRE